MCCNFFFLWFVWNSLTSSTAICSMSWIVSSWCCCIRVHNILRISNRHLPYVTAATDRRTRRQYARGWRGRMRNVGTENHRGRFDSKLSNSFVKPGRALISACVGECPQPIWFAPFNLALIFNIKFDTLEKNHFARYFSAAHQQPLFVFWRLRTEGFDNVETLSACGIFLGIFMRRNNNHE